MVDYILKLDKVIILWVQNIRCAPLSVVMKFITHLGSMGIIWILFGLAMVISPKYRKTGIVTLITLAVSYVLNDLVIKELVQRQRPYEAIEALTSLVGRENTYSFPSGHSCSSFGAAGAIWHLHKNKMGTVALCIAGMIAISRLYVGVHYLTDILAGALLGFGVSTLVVYLSKKLLEKLREQ